MLCPPEAQAVTTAVLGPLALNIIATLPAAIFPIIIGIKNGLTRSGPFSRKRECCSSKVSIPPIPEPMAVPVRSGQGKPLFNPASSIAMAEAATANWVNRSIRRFSLRSMKSSASKSLTSAASFALLLVTSNLVIMPMPFSPLHKPPQNFSVPVPRGVIAPKPVITTRFFMLTPSLHYHAAVYMDHLASDIAAVFGSKERNQISDIFRLAELLQRNQPENTVFNFV